MQARSSFFDGMCQILQSESAVVPRLDETREVVVCFQFGFVLGGDAAEGGVLVVEQGLVFRELGGILRLGLCDYGGCCWKEVSMD